MLRHVPKVMSGVTVIMHTERQKSRSFNAPTRLHTWNSCRHVEKFLLKIFTSEFTPDSDTDSLNIDNKLILGQTLEMTFDKSLLQLSCTFKAFFCFVRHFSPQKKLLKGRQHPGLALPLSLTTQLQVKNGAAGGSKH